MSVLSVEAQVLISPASFFFLYWLFYILWDVFCCPRFHPQFIMISGEVISDRDRCTRCKGNKVIQEKKVLEVHVEKGMQNGQKIVFEGQADEAVSKFSMAFGFKHFDQAILNSFLPGSVSQVISF